MIALTYSGVNYLLVNDAPNWRDKFRVDFDATWDEQVSLTKQAIRRPYTDTLRLTINCNLYSFGANLRGLQASLRGLKAQPVLFPFWPVVSFIKDLASMFITGNTLIAFKADWSSYQIFVRGDLPVGFGDYDLVCPLLSGFLQQKSDLKFKSVDFAVLAVQFTESSSASFQLFLDQQTFQDGPASIGGTTHKIFPFRPNHSDVTESLVVDVAHEKFGFNRIQRTTYYPHDPYRQQQSRYVLKTSDDIFDMLAFVYQNTSKGAPFWVAGSLAVGYLSANYAANSATLSLTDYNIQASDFICTFDASGNLLFAHVSAIGANATLDVAFTEDLPAGQPIYSFSLASIAQGKLSVEWPGMGLATISKLLWNEVRPETYIPIGVTAIGQQKMRAYFFDFWRDFGNGTITHWRFTSFEQDITWNGYTWTSGAFTLGDIVSTLNLENDSCSFESALTLLDGTLDASNPLVQDISLTSEVPLNLSIFSADIIYAEVPHIIPPPPTDIIGPGGDEILGVGGEVLQPVSG